MFGKRYNSHDNKSIIVHHDILSTDSNCSKVKKNLSVDTHCFMLTIRKILFVWFKFKTLKILRSTEENLLPKSAKEML